MIDGRVRLYRVIQKIADGLDRHNALQGIGVIVLLGNVVTPFPNLKVALEGASQLSDEAIYLTLDTLLIPDHIRLTQGDRITLLPVQAAGGMKFLVQSKLRTTDRQPTTDSRLGYNGDISGGIFCGVQVHVVGTNGLNDSVVNIVGDSITITSFGGASVVIDGINFKNHKHSDPQGSMSGPPV
jgi:hypothetical protein